MLSAKCACLPSRLDLYKGVDEVDEVNKDNGVGIKQKAFFHSNCTARCLESYAGKEGSRG
jgi:hypothetical protein